jgi:type IV secretion system protein VirB10
MAEAEANLQIYQSQLDGMLRQLQGLTDQATGTGAATAAGAVANGQGLLSHQVAQVAAGMPIHGVSPNGMPGTTSGGSSRQPPLFGQLERSQTPRAAATMLGDRSLVIPKGVLFHCALKTRIVSAVSGFVGCQVQRPVFSDDGRVVLIERGSHLDGEYRIVQVRPGMTRIPVLWTRVRTPHGVTVDLDSPATGALGESGIGGNVDNRWGERIGAALLLSLIDDAIKVQSSETQASGGTVVLPNTMATGSRLAEKVLESTINIPPLITTHQGSVVSVYVSRDLDFAGVYRLVAR